MTSPDTPHIPPHEKRSHHEQLSPDERMLFVDELEAKHAELSPDEARWHESYKGYAERIILEGTDDQASAAAEISLGETLHGNPIPDLLGKWGFSDVYDKRQQLIGIAVDEPELAHAIVANNVAGFHGSNSSSLLGVLEHGVLSSREARRRNLALGSGERTFTDHSHSPFISFADWRAPDSLRQYANNGAELPRSIEDYRRIITKVQQSISEAVQLWGDTHPFAVNGQLVIEDTQRLIERLESEPVSVETELITANFPVLYGIDISEYERVPTYYGVPDNPGRVTLVERVQSDVRGEFAIFNGNVSPDRIPIIAVPASRVIMVRQLVREAGHGIDVYPIDALITRHR